MKGQGKGRDKGERGRRMWREGSGRGRKGREGEGGKGEMRVDSTKLTRKSTPVEMHVHA